MSDRSVAMKAMNLTSEFRSVLRLMERSRSVSSSYVASARSECAQYLAQSLLIYPPSLSRLGLKEGQTLEERRIILSIPFRQVDDTEEELIFKQMLDQSGRKCRQSNWIWRIGQECCEMAREGWYGFFVTLTVDPSRCADSEAMWKEGRELRRYLRRLGRVAARACGMPNAIKDGASVSQFVRHVGVIEHGKSNHHHHMHLLLWMRDVPDSWKVCPNREFVRPEAKTADWCRPMSTFWPWSLPGIGRAKYFRHEGDVWSKHGFVLPFDSKKKRVIRINNPAKAGFYIAKYMDKENKAWTHRVKATRNIGLNRLKKLLMEMALSKVEALTWRPVTYSMSIFQQKTQSVPQGLLRSKAKQELFCRNWVSGRLDWMQLLNENCGVFLKMLKSVRDGARPKRMSSDRFYAWVSEHLPAVEGYCEKRLARATVSLAVEFPVFRSVQVQHLGVN